MSSPGTSSTPRKAAFKRPYKSRTQRREIDRGKYEQAKEHRFLKRAALVVGLLAVIALSLFVKGMMDQESAPVQPVETPQL